MSRRKSLPSASPSSRCCGCRSDLSCPAKAGHPVIAGSAVITGSSAGACHRAGHFGPDPMADDDTDDDGSARLAKPVVERIAGAAHGADRIDGVAAVERLAQAADMDVNGALVDIDVAAPHAVEQLLAGKHPAGAFHEEFEQAELGRAEIDRAGRSRHALLFAIELEVADVEHHGD